MSDKSKAFDDLRAHVGEARHPPAQLIANKDQTVQMNQEHGLQVWQDREKVTSESSSISKAPPEITPAMLAQQHLWVVRQDDVVHALEKCEFGLTLESKVIKHTNLTGGAAAYCGGELLFLNEKTVVINGCSGRYGPRSEEEMLLAAKAFSNSGYKVWHMGYDDEADRPIPFIGVKPQLAE
jgi:hypothetical protein